MPEEAQQRVVENSFGKISVPSAKMR